MTNHRRKAGREEVARRLVRQGLTVLVSSLLLAGCVGIRERDALGAQYFPDPAYGGRRTAFQPRPEGYAPPPVPPAVQVWPPGPF